MGGLIPVPDDVRNEVGVLLIPAHTPVVQVNVDVIVVRIVEGEPVHLVSVHVTVLEVVIVVTIVVPLREVVGVGLPDAGSVFKLVVMGRLLVGDVEPVPGADEDRLEDGAEEIGVLEGTEDVNDLEGSDEVEDRTEEIEKLDGIDVVRMDEVAEVDGIKVVLTDDLEMLVDVEAEGQHIINSGKLESAK
ncbi:hypothetical protein BAUCODRAFT_514306 [Baudoinia panamericana UAMH 10762]|uniref:Uncharacterized protein n=1 Tax=Baudoinia panamericana (strain UAMH 10762) TaxID=717646 RepID=M2NA89_BAUPA|nr:uncharacterized protein BAUCODRAFT_514306 [Baudoinia panamericana UAMH 10762]EMC96039.1 hypothetical protein BAUCODRAFT_514306 [Baudoinia panamericana UAMH 10762]